MHQLDGVRQRRGAVLHQSKTDGIKSGQALIARERTADGGGAVWVVENCQRFVLEKR